MPASEIEVPVARLRRLYAIVGAIALVLTACVFYFPMRLMLRPLASIAESARRVARCDFGARAQIDLRDEIGDLAHTFDVMTQAVDERTRRLEQKAEQVARRQKDVRFECSRLGAVIRSMHDAVFIPDRDGEVTLSNEAAAPLVRSLAGSLLLAEPLARTDPGDGGTCLECLADFSHRHRSCLVGVESRLCEIHDIPFPATAATSPSGTRPTPGSRLWPRGWTVPWMPAA